MRRRLIRLIFLPSFCLLFAACSSYEPELAAVYACVVFDYAGAGTPQVRLAAFVQPSEEFRRVSSLAVECEGAKLLWRVAEPQLVKAGDGAWTGSAALAPPSRGSLPQGVYRATYTDLASRSAECSFAVEYPAALCACSYEKLESSPDYQKLSESYIVLYDDAGALVAFAADDGSSPEELAQKYAAAKTLRRYKGGKGKGYGVLLPALELAKS